jgi:hypothetical protein
MSKPFATHAENAIWAVMEQGPLKVTEIGNAIDWKGKGNSLSAMVAGVWSRLGDMHEGAAGILTRYHHSGAFCYKRSEKGKDVSVEQAIELYRSVGRKQHRAKVDKKKEDAFANCAIGTDEMEPEVENKDSMSKAIEQAIKQSLGLDVNVNGRIEIVFKLGG